MEKVKEGLTAVDKAGINAGQKLENGTQGAREKCEPVGTGAGKAFVATGFIPSTLHHTSPTINTKIKACTWTTDLNSHSNAAEALEHGLEKTAEAFEGVEKKLEEVVQTVGAKIDEGAKKLMTGLDEQGKKIEAKHIAEDGKLEHAIHAAEKKVGEVVSKHANKD